MKVDFWNYTKLNNWKKIQPENSAEKITLQKTRNYLKIEHVDKTEKKKILKFKELYFPDTFSYKFPQITLKFETLYLFYPFLSCFFCIKFPLKNFIVLSFRISIRTRKLWNLPFELTV